MKTINYPEDILYAVAHQLKNPINAIIGFSEILKKMISESNLNRKDCIEFTNDIISVAGDMNELVDDLVDVNMACLYTASIESKEAVNLEDIILRSARIHRELLIQKKVFLKIKIENDIGVVFLGKRTLKQIFHNIISNSIRNSPENTEVTIIADRISKQNSKYVCISISDQGVGMSEEKIDFVLNASNYLNKHNSSSLNYSPDLTLSITKELIQRQDGKIYISSQINSGTSIVIEFPVKDNTS